MAHLYLPGSRAVFYVGFEKPTGEAVTPVSPTITIVRISNSVVNKIIDAAALTQLQTGAYYYEWVVPADADVGEYGVIYNGTIDGVVGQTTETFTVANFIQGDDTIYGSAPKVTGTVTNSQGVAIGGCRIVALGPNGAVNSTTTEADGTWEMHLPPGQYVVRFMLAGYVSYENQIVVPDSAEVIFDNIIV